jgi:hypothetical protein
MPHASPKSEWRAGALPRTSSLHKFTIFRVVQVLSEYSENKASSISKKERGLISTGTKPSLLSWAIHTRCTLMNSEATDRANTEYQLPTNSEISPLALPGQHQV